MFPTKNTEKISARFARSILLYLLFPHVADMITVSPLTRPYMIIMMYTYEYKWTKTKTYVFLQNMFYQYENQNDGKR